MTTDSRPDHDSNTLLGLGCNEGLGPNAEATPDLAGTVETLAYRLGEAHAELRMLRESAQQTAAHAEQLHTFLNAAAGEGLVLDSVDAADLYIAMFPERYAATVAGLGA